ncbi:MAG: type II secretion system F family protein [Alphaproteobacteria bacterium]
MDLTMPDNAFLQELLAPDSTLLQQLLVMLLILLMLAGGLAMIALGSRERAKKLSARVDRVQAVSGRPQKAEIPKQSLEGRVMPKAEKGLTEAEHRHIMRVFERFGVPADKAISRFNVVRLIVTLVAAGGATPFVSGLAAKSIALALLAVCGAGAVGWLAPMFIIRKGIEKRRKSIGKGLPDALELLAVCVEAGLSLENGLQRVSRELKHSQPALAEELSQTWAEINILPDRDQALTNFADRVDLPSVRSVVNTLSQTLRYGTPLARSLRVVAGDVRNDQLTLMEERANKLPAMMTVPVMVFIMPTIFLIVGGPAALKLMDTFYK